MAIENGVFIVDSQTQNNSTSISTSPRKNIVVAAGYSDSISDVSLSNQNRADVSISRSGKVNATITANNSVSTSIENSASTTLSLSNNKTIEAIAAMRGLPGRGIVSVLKTGSRGLVDIYTITYTDNSTSTFEVTNGSSGEGGGTSDYEQLYNLPSINGVTLEGNKTTEDLLIDIDGDKNYTHNQTTASDTWVIVHGLNKYPSVNVINSAGDEVVGDIIYNDTNQITIKFNGSFKGSATLN